MFDTVQPQVRSAYLFAFLLDERVPDEQRVHVYRSMMSAKVFPEFTKFSDGEHMLSIAVLVKQGVIPGQPDFSTAISPNDARAILRSESAHRRKLVASAGLISAAQKIHDSNPQEIQSLVADAVGNIREKQSREHFVDGAAAYEKAKSQPMGILTGSKALDDVARGLMYGTMTVVFGYVSSGKSTFMLNCAYQAAVRGFNVVFITLEVPRELMHFQTLSLHSFRAAERLGGDPIEYIRILKGELSEQERGYLFGKVETDFKSQKGKVTFAEFDDIEDFSYMGLHNYLKALPFFADVVILDYAQLLTPLIKVDRFTEKYMEARMVRDFTHLATGSGSGDQRIVLIGAQANRDGWLRAEENDGAFDMRAIADINQLERDAYYVISLFNDEDLRRSFEVKLCLLKNKSGPIIGRPITAPFDPRFCAVGNDVSGVTDRISNKDLEDVMGGGFDLKSLMGA